MTIRADFPAAVLVHVEEAATTSTETDRMSLSIRRVSLRDAPVNCGERYGLKDVSRQRRCAAARSTGSATIAVRGLASSRERTDPVSHSRVRAARTRPHDSSSTGTCSRAGGVRS
jgi:hypothetical protein